MKSYIVFPTMTDYPSALSYMKISTLFYFLIFSFLSGCSYTIKDEESKERDLVLKNNIKKIIEYRTITNPGGVTLKEQLCCEKLFDNYGFKVKEITHNDDGNIESIISLNYDTSGNLILRKAVRPDSSISYADKRVYDKNNHKTDYYFYNPDGSVLYRKSMVYDYSGRMIESRMFHDGILKAVNKYKYEGKRMIENDEFDSIGNFRHKWLYRYDELGNLIEEAQFNTQNYCTIKNIYEFNAANKMIKEIKYTGDYLQFIGVYEYDNKNLLSGKTVYNAGKISAKYRYKYDFLIRI